MKQIYTPSGSCLGLACCETYDGIYAEKRAKNNIAQVSAFRKFPEWAGMSWKFGAIQLTHLFVTPEPPAELCSIVLMQIRERSVSALLSFHLVSALLLLVARGCRHIGS